MHSSAASRALQRQTPNYSTPSLPHERVSSSPGNFTKAAFAFLGGLGFVLTAADAWEVSDEAIGSQVRNESLRYGSGTQFG